jgi:hypothetical protein
MILIPALFTYFMFGKHNRRNTRRDTNTNRIYEVRRWNGLGAVSRNQDSWRLGSGIQISLLWESRLKAWLLGVLYLYVLYFLRTPPVTFVRLFPKMPRYKWPHCFFSDFVTDSLSPICPFIYRSRVFTHFFLLSLITLSTFLDA